MNHFDSDTYEMLFEELSKCGLPVVESYFTNTMMLLGCPYYL
jgi:hypothetical protein